jgi:5-methylcytosine-specific restriction endonuclease McrA
MQRETRLSQKQILELLRCQDYRCALTGRLLTPETASLDHRVPLSRGGPNTMDNVIIVHRSVNRAKGTLLVEEFIAMCQEVVDHEKSSQPQPAQQTEA